MDKETQFTSAMEAINFDKIDFENPTNAKKEVSKNTAQINKMQQILDEEDSLISEFAGATVKVTGDANKYANEALTNIRESHKYKLKTISAFRDINTIMSDSIAASETNNVDELNKLQKKSETISTTDAEKADEYARKATDAIKKLEALQ